MSMVMLTSAAATDPSSRFCPKMILADPSSVACLFSIGSFCLLARSTPAPAPVCGCQCDCGTPGWPTSVVLAVALGQLATGFLLARLWRGASQVPVSTFPAQAPTRYLTLPAGARGRLEGGD